MKDYWRKLPDWLKRAIKTFVETFFTFIIMAISSKLSTGWPENWTVLKTTLISIVGGALSAAITAAWNIILERFKQ